MGYFSNIYLSNFRNFEIFSNEFSKHINVFFGKNGSGKTNILEAISLFSKGRGLKKDKISNIIKYNQNKFIIKSSFKNEDIVYNLQVETTEKNKIVKKKLTINNDNSRESLDQFYKQIPFLFFLPETERLFIASPSKRRDFIDRFIFTHNNNYNKSINQYNKSILERAKLLTNESYDSSWLNRIEESISDCGLQIYISRNNQIRYLEENLNLFLNKFNLSFQISIKLIDKFYKSGLNEGKFREELKINRNIDKFIGGSKIGPHKSDYLFVINNSYSASQLSTGQQKTLILLLFLSQSKYLFDYFRIKPILLFDEVCSHLDDSNRKILLTLLEDFDLQIFMTGTTKNLFSFLSTNTNFCNIVNL